LSSKDTKDEEVKFADRYASATTVPNTRQHHCFILTETDKIRIQFMSSSNQEQSGQRIKRRSL
jgi:hypothetical protein